MKFSSFLTHKKMRGRVAAGKTLISSSLMDRGAADLDRPLAEVPVFLKRVVEGLKSGAYGIGQ